MKNVKFIIGVVVYTGLDTKIMKNAEEAKFKESNIETLTNKLIIYIFYVGLIQIKYRFNFAFAPQAHC